MPVPQTLPEIKNAILRDTLDTLLEASTWTRVDRSAWLAINKATAATLAEVDEEDVPSEGDLPIPFASDNIHVHCGLNPSQQQLYSLVVVDATQPVYDGDVPPDDRFDNNKEVTVDVTQYVAPVEVFPTYGKEAMKKVTVSLDNIPEIEANKAATINVSSYTEPVEVIPTVGKDGMAKATVTLSHVPSGNVPNFFNDTIPGFILKATPDAEGYPYYGVYADGTYVPSLAELANAQFFVPAYHGGNHDDVYRTGSTATIPHNTIFGYVDDNDFTVTDGKITLKRYAGDSGIEYYIETATLYLNNCMASAGS